MARRWLLILLLWTPASAWAQATDADLRQILIHRDTRPGLAPERSTYLGWSGDFGPGSSSTGGSIDFTFFRVPNRTLGLAVDAGVIDQAGRTDFRIDSGVLIPVGRHRLGLFGTAAQARVPRALSGTAVRIGAVWEFPLGQGRIAPFLSVPLRDDHFDGDDKAEVEIVQEVGVAYAVDMGVCDCIGLQARLGYLDSDVRHVSASAVLAFRLAQYMAFTVSAGGEEQPLGPDELGYIRVGFRFGHWNELRNEPGSLRTVPLWIPLTMSYSSRH
ncbi:MAG: hypothetical protein ABUT39_14905 [Acidobacteriota bacterium]